jgi:peptidoglycan/xylan/chitin deacetylase (PgdA/CDA1 family)
VSALARALVWAGSRGNAARRLLILTYHRVLPARDAQLRGDPTAGEFDTQVETLKSRFRVVRLDEGVARLRDGTLEPASVALTFDDGYADNHDVALPILRKHGVPATFFIANGYLDGRRMWNDTVIESVRRMSQASLRLSELDAGLAEASLPLGTADEKYATTQAIIDAIKHLAPPRREAITRRLGELAATPLPDDLMMTSAKVRALHSAGMLIGAHTVHHPVLTAVDPNSAEREIADGREALANIIGEPIRFFAYPNGRPGRDYDRRHVDIVRRLGFEAAVSTAHGYAGADSDFSQLPRIAAWSTRPWHLTAQLLKALREPQTQCA